MVMAPHLRGVLEGRHEPKPSTSERRRAASAVLGLAPPAAPVPEARMNRRGSSLPSAQAIQENRIPRGTRNEPGRFGVQARFRPSFR